MLEAGDGQRLSLPVALTNVLRAASRRGDGSCPPPSRRFRRRRAAPNWNRRLVRRPALWRLGHAHRVGAGANVVRRKDENVMEPVRLRGVAEQLVSLGVKRRRIT